MSRHLIVQGHTPDETVLEQIAGLADARDIQRLSSNVFRMTQIKTTEPATIADLCARHRLDFGIIPAERRLEHFRLIAMDMDSTLIAIECIDEIGDMLNIKPQIAAITEAAMRGEMEFAESLTRRVALLAGLEIELLERVYQERVQLNPGAESLLARARQFGIKTLLVSGGFTFFTDRLHSHLQLDYSAANPLEIVDGRLTGRVLGTILDAQAKADWLNRVRQALGAQPAQTVAIGDGANDLRMMAQAGVSVAWHAKPVVQRQAGYAINFNGLDAVLALLGDNFED